MKLLREDICFIISYELYLQITERTELRRKFREYRVVSSNNYVYICNKYHLNSLKYDETTYEPRYAEGVGTNRPVYLRFGFLGTYTSFNG